MKMELNVFSKIRSLKMKNARVYYLPIISNYIYIKMTYGASMYLH